MRIFVDTNIVVSATIFGGVCRELMQAGEDGHALLISDYVLAEFVRTVRKKFKIPDEALQPIVKELRALEQVDAELPFDVLLRDFADRPIIGAALAGRADVLVTGDQDLLVLGAVGPLEILTPRQLLVRLNT